MGFWVVLGGLWVMGLDLAWQRYRRMSRTDRRAERDEADTLGGT